MKRSSKEAARQTTTDEAKLDLYLRRAFAIAAPHVVDGKVHFSALDEKALDEKLEEGNKSEDILIAQIPDSNAEALEWDRFGSIQLQEAYESSLKSANVIRGKLANDIRMDHPLPVGLRHFLALILDRRVKEPQNPKNRPKLAHRDLLLKAIGILLRDEFKLTIGAQQLTLAKQSEMPIRGATIAAAALYGLGCTEITLQQALKIVAKKKVDPTELIEAGIIDEPDAPILLVPRPHFSEEAPMIKALRFLNRK